MRDVECVCVCGRGVGDGGKRYVSHEPLANEEGLGMTFLGPMNPASYAPCCVALVLVWVFLCHGAMCLVSRRDVPSSTILLPPCAPMPLVPPLCVRRAIPRTAHNCGRDRQATRHKQWHRGVAQCILQRHRSPRQWQWQQSGRGRIQACIRGAGRWGAAGIRCQRRWYALRCAQLVLIM